MKHTSARGVLLIMFAPLLAAQSVEHRIAEGETLFSIARRYEVGVDELVAVNGIEDPRLLIPGMVIRIPDEADAEYRVTRGDTLFSIARRFGTTVEELAATNGLRDNTIRVGQLLRVPAPAPRRGRTPAPDGDAARDDPPARDQGAEPAIPVAAAVVEPLSFADGGAWPVAGARREMDGKLPGVMIRAERGTPVSAISGGRVVYAGPHSTFGNVVFVQSAQGYIYVYGGQESIAVAVGEEVGAGATLGTVGVSPQEGGGALYFSVWRNDRFVDPEIAPRG